MGRLGPATRECMTYATQRIHAWMMRRMFRTSRSDRIIKLSWLAVAVFRLLVGGRHRPDSMAARPTKLAITWRRCS